jgi:hypothetical protein
MVTENPPATEERPGEVLEEKLSLHIYLTKEGYEKIKKWAEYAAVEGFIEGHPRGNFSSYTNWCFQLGENFLMQHILKKRGYK